MDLVAVHHPYPAAFSTSINHFIAGKMCAPSFQNTSSHEAAKLSQTEFRRSRYTLDVV